MIVPFTNCHDPLAHSGLSGEWTKVNLKEANRVETGGQKIAVLILSTQCGPWSISSVDITRELVKKQES